MQMSENRADASDGGVSALAFPRFFVISFGIRSVAPVAFCLGLRRLGRKL